MKMQPNEPNDGSTLHYDQINDDFQHFNNPIHGDTKEDRLTALIHLKQEALPAGLIPSRLDGFESYPKYEQLQHMATHGIQSFIKPDFIPNQAKGDYSRTPQYRRLKPTIIKHLRKLQDKGRIIILPKAEVEGMEGVHISALHVTPNACRKKWRICIDATESGLNPGTDMEAMMAYLGEFKMPTLTEVAGLVHHAGTHEQGVLHKTDVSQAFNNMLLEASTAMLQMFQVGEYAIVPVVSGFGWAGAPAHYNIIAGAIDWAHNGGVTSDQIDQWTKQLGWEVLPQHPEPSWNPRWRSITYVDDSIGQSSVITGPRDMADLKTITATLLGPPAYNYEKTEGPSTTMTALGWDCDIPKGTIQPSKRGLYKIYHWVFTGLNADHVPINDVQKAVGVLRWYSAVIPMASTRELQNALTKAEAIKLAYPHKKFHVCHINQAVKRELQWWQWILKLHMQDDMLSTPAWYLAKLHGEREQVEIFTDASTTTGGGYIWHEHSYSSMKWSQDEKLLFGPANRPTDINGLELITAICAIIAERHTLRGKTVVLRVDNTAAVVWLNKTRTKQAWGQAWMKLLIAVLLEFDILLTSVHVPGDTNIYADELSREIQSQRLKEATQGLKKQQLLSAESREKIWAMPLTAHLPEEYLEILRSLEAQDSTRSLIPARSTSSGHTPTSLEKTKN